jgi:hypothetical protein
MYWKHLAMAHNLEFNYSHLQIENKESSTDVDVIWLDVIEKNIWAPPIG